MELTFREELAQVPNLRHAVRQMRWLRASFRHDAALVGQRYGIDYAIDDKKLADAFLRWIDAFSRQKAFSAVDRKDFAVYSAGLFLRELMRAHPARVRSHVLPEGDQAGTQNIVHFWPEGFLYSNFCLSILSVVLEQEFGETLTLSALADDLRTWWSFRDNAESDPAIAVAFFDQMIGREPNWWVPDAADSRAAIRKAQHVRSLASRLL